MREKGGGGSHVHVNLMTISPELLYDLLEDGFFRVLDWHLRIHASGNLLELLLDTVW